MVRIRCSPVTVHSRRATGEKAAPKLPEDNLRNVVSPMSFRNEDAYLSSENLSVSVGDRAGGMGCRKKRMPCCNGMDRGSRFAPLEREQTSGRSSMTKKLERLNSEVN